MHTEQVEADSGFASEQHLHVHPSAEAGFTATPPKEMTLVGACVVMGGVVVVVGGVVVALAVVGLASSVLPPRLKAPPKENGSEDDEDGVDSEKEGTGCVVDVVSVVFGCELLSLPLVVVLSFGDSAGLDWGAAKEKEGVNDEEGEVKLSEEPDGVEKENGVAVVEVADVVVGALESVGANGLLSGAKENGGGAGGESVPAVKGDGEGSKVGVGKVGAGPEGRGKPVVVAGGVERPPPVMAVRRGEIILLSPPLMFR